MSTVFTFTLLSFTQRRKVRRELYHAADRQTLVEFVESHNNMEWKIVVKVVFEFFIPKTENGTFNFSRWHTTKIAQNLIAVWKEIYFLTFAYSVIEMDSHACTHHFRHFFHTENVISTNNNIMRGMWNLLKKFFSTKLVIPNVRRNWLTKSLIRWTKWERRWHNNYSNKKWIKKKNCSSLDGQTRTFL